MQLPRLDLVGSLWWVAIAMTLHEAEEWNIADWIEHNFDNHSCISDPAIWLGVALISVLFVGWIFVATRFRDPLVISIVALVPVGLIATGNAFQHIAWTVRFGEYAPGVVSSVLLVLPAAALAMRRFVEVRRAFVAPLALCAVLWVVAVVQILGMSRQLEPFQLVLHETLIRIAEFLGLPGHGTC